MSIKHAHQLAPVAMSDIYTILRSPIVWQTAWIDQNHGSWQTNHARQASRQRSPLSPFSFSLPVLNPE
jgi:hypothetical protein